MITIFKTSKSKLLNLWRWFYWHFLSWGETWDEMYDWITNDDVDCDDRDIVHPIEIRNGKIYYLDE